MVTAVDVPCAKIMQHVKSISFYSRKQSEKFSQSKKKWSSCAKFCTRSSRKTAQLLVQSYNNLIKLTWGSFFPSARGRKLGSSPFVFSVPVCTWGIHEEWRQLIIGTACLEDVVNSSRFAVFKSWLDVFLKDMQYFNLKLWWCKNCWAKLCDLYCGKGQSR